VTTDGPNGFGAPPPERLPPPPGPSQGADQVPPPAWGWAPDARAQRPAGPAPGPVPLRPMNVGDVLDGAFRLLRARWRTMLIVAAVVVVPVQLVSSYFTRALFTTSLFEMVGDPVTMSEAMESGSWVGDLVSLLYAVVFLPLVTGALAWVAVVSALGENPPWQEALGRALRRTWALMISWAVAIFLLSLPIMVGAGIVAFGVIAGTTAAIVVGVVVLLAGLVAALGIWALFALAPPAIMHEHLGGMRGLGRSARLVRRRFWPVLGTVLLAGLVTSIVSAALSGIPSWFAFVLGDYGWLLAAAGAMIGSLVTTPFLASVLALLYLDGRIRHEGLDLQLAADQMTTSWGGGGLGR
jgi:hypothetical protein